MDDWTYKEVIRELQPAVYVVPDVFKDPEATRERLLQWLPESLVSATPMYVLHWCGSVEATATHLTDLERLVNEPFRVGLPKALEGRNRVVLAEWLAGWLNLHALGFSDDMLLTELPFLSRWGIESIDSTVPINRGLQGIQLGQPTKLRWNDFNSQMHRRYDAGDYIAQRNLNLVDFLCR